MENLGESHHRSVIVLILILILNFLSEKLRRKDLEVSKALEEKQRLIADILHIPFDDFDHIVDIASQPLPDRDAREVLLAALAQGENIQDVTFQRNLL